MAITLADFNKIWASTSPLTPYSFSESNYKQGWNFIGSTPPARQMWDFLQKNNDEKMQYLANNYLPLSGGTMTGDITMSAEYIKRNNNDNILTLCGGTSWRYGALLSLNGKDKTGDGGNFSLTAKNDNNSSSLLGKPDGSLTWGGNNVLTSNGGVIVEVKSTTYDITGNASVSLQLDVSKQGYTLIGIVGYRTFSEFICPFQVWINDNLACAYVKNFSSNSFTGSNFRWDVLYVKS